MFCSRALGKLVRTLNAPRSKHCRSSSVGILDSLTSHLRYCSSGASVHELKSRGLLELRGRDTKDFLQGLVTSDVTQLGADNPVQYSMMLNVQGRVLYDLLLYSTPGLESADTQVLVECDRSVMEEMVKIMRRYKIRKKVDISVMGEEWRVLAAVRREDGATVDLTGGVPDPRVPGFGWRIPSKGEPDLADVSLQEESEYHRARYEWGIPEGVADLPPGNCFPLESNLILHNGVSFLKGCYLGQELTARTHHTGVTRKRLMPLGFHRDVTGEIEAGTNITREDGKNVGKFRNAVGQNGLGLMRMADLKGELTVINKKGDSVVVTARKPSWWPQDIQG